MAGKMTVEFDFRGLHVDLNFHHGSLDSHGPTVGGGAILECISSLTQHQRWAIHLLVDWAKGTRAGFQRATGMGMIRENLKVVRWVAIAVTLMKEKWVQVADTAGSGAIFTALLQCSLEFPFHQYAIDAIHMVIKRLEVERSLDETSFPFTLFFPGLRRYAHRNVLKNVPCARLIFIRSKCTDTLQIIAGDGGHSYLEKRAQQWRQTSRRIDTDAICQQAE